MATHTHRAFCLNAISTIITLLMLCAFAPLAVAATDNSVVVTITDPFIELHTGPGARYPVFYVVDRGQKVRLLLRKTRWFKLRAQNGKSGWANRQQLQNTLLPSGQALRFKSQNRDAFVQRSWELGALSGAIKDAPLLSVYAAYTFTENLSLELDLEHAVGNVSSNNLVKLQLLMQPFPDWKYSPFFSMAAGAIQVKPNATLINPADKNNPLSQIGLGVKSWLSRRFVLRAELDRILIFSANNDKDKNEDLTEWKIGFAIFF